MRKKIRKRARIRPDIQDQLRKILDDRPGTADSDIDTLTAIMIRVPLGIIAAAYYEIKRLRAK
jgi:hypothetical protein